MIHLRSLRVREGSASLKVPVAGPATLQITMYMSSAKVLSSDYLWEFTFNVQLQIPMTTEPLGVKLFFSACEAMWNRA